MKRGVICPVVAIGLAGDPLCAEHIAGPVCDEAHLPASTEQVPEGLSAADWSALRAIHEAGRHTAVCGVDGTVVARNPRQRWQTRFDGRGFMVTPDGGEWTWGLELRRYGFPGAERAVGMAARVSHEGGEVSYDWDAVLREWFVNDGRGLQQGWTVKERPMGTREARPLRLEYAVRGGLRPVVRADGVGVDFLDASGMWAVDFGGLRAWDANGRALIARFETSGCDASVLWVAIEEGGARYPITVDPVAQQAYLKASNTGASDYFGCSVAVSGDTVVVGAYGESSGATGVNGNQADNSVASAGAAYVFVRDGTNWIQQAYLKASNTGTNDEFGCALSLSGDTVLIGARREDSGATGVNGNQADNSVTDAGAAYVFMRAGTNWIQQAYLKASNSGNSDQFGYSVALSGDTAVIGAWGEDSNATGVNGDQSNNSASSAGAAYVFVREGSNWGQQAYLKASNTDGSDYFGYSVAVLGDTVVVGAHREDSNATGVNGDQSNNSASSAGAAYVFVREGSNWGQQAYLKASNTDGSDYFGYSVAVSGDTAVIGANWEASIATGVNGDQSDNTASQAGAAYAFVRAGTNWSQQAYLKASNTGAGDYFGASVAMSGDTIMVGANGEDGSASSAGAAYAFVREGSNWSQRAYLKASNPDALDYFGISVAVSCDTAVIGAYWEDSNATGVNGDRLNNSASAAGAAYVFHVPPPLQEMVVEQPAGAEVIDGGIRGYGGIPCDGFASLMFTIRNIGESNLTGLAITKDGADADDFTVTSSPVAPVAPGSNTPFVIEFAPASGGAKTATIHIESNDENENTFDITLTGRGLSTADDSDGDGMNDAAEFKLASLGFDWQTDNGSLVTTYYAAASTAGLYTEGDIRNLCVGAPLVSVSNGVVVLELQLQKSDDLKTWTPFGDPVQWSESASGKCFYRLFFDEGAQP